MYSALVFGFEDQIDELMKSDYFKIKIFIGKSSQCSIDYKKICRLDISYNRINKDSYKIYKKIYNSYFSDFINMCARHDLRNIRAHHDYFDIFNIYFNFFYNLLVDNNIDLYLTSCLPHVGSDNLIYLIAKELNIKTVIMHQSIFPNKLFYMTNVNDYAEFHKYKPLRKKEKYIIKDNQVTVHANLDLKKVKRYKFPFKKIFLGIINNKDFSNFWKYKRFKRYYNDIESLTNYNFNLNDNFVYFPLQLNPELTTSFLGLDFFDQVLAIERLSDLIPKGWKIYIKENPKQTEFMRGRWFFKRLMVLKNIIFVPFNTDTYTLIRKSQFVSTVTGTAGWEAITNFKNVLIFGNAWYKHLSGVFKYTDDFKIDVILDYKIDKHKLENEISDMLTKFGEGVVEMVYKEVVPNYDRKTNSNKIRLLIEKVIKEHN